jgi:large subunit ribosomal protein L34e
LAFRNLYKSPIILEDKMPQPRRRSRTYRRIKKKMPGGKVKLTYEKRKPGLPKCALCGAELKGMSRLRDFKSRNTPKTKKRPERLYGGFLCANCVRQKLKAEARASQTSQ